MRRNDDFSPARSSSEREVQPAGIGPHPAWRFCRGERIGLTIACVALLAFGVNLEQRTALRWRPMTDLGVFTAAGWAVRTGEDLYSITDWNGWHYNFPPFIAVLFTPLANPLPAPLPGLKPGEIRTEANTPWGYSLSNGHRFYGLHRENARFFVIVAVWYFLSVALTALAAQAVGCALDGSRLRDGPPGEARARRRWWLVRAVPLLVCAGSIGTDFSRGQVDVLMLAAIALALYLAARGREWAAGLWLAVPAAVKLFPLVLLLYPFWRLRARMMLGALVGLALTFVVIPAVALGPARTVALYRTWVDVLAGPALGYGQDRSRGAELLRMNSTDNVSLLECIHNWVHRTLPRARRPPEAAPGNRTAVWVVGALLLAGLGWAAGWRRSDSARGRVLLVGLLVGLGLVINPVVHNHYYLLLVPLIGGVLDRYYEDSLRPPSLANLPWLLWLFLVVELCARLPRIEWELRDLGVPLVCLLALMGVGAAALRRENRETRPVAV